ncbi:IS607 family transposase [Allocoleopsis franciscana]|uniref:IS607 family transposase n=1 Tax=Allocoleopsis franciscana TaxID=2886352 RepID=UPI0005A2CEF3|nr:IS607 family transposase [Allocoleopsis franciscana]
MSNNKNHVPPRVAAARLGVSTKTLERWLEAGKIKAFITPGGQRRYDLDSIIPAGDTERISIIYARVSSRSQKNDLLTQIDFLQSHYPNAKIIQDIGSGLNYRRKGFLSLLERILSNDVGLVVVAHKDRLCRFGFDLVAWLCERQKCELLVLNQSHLSPEREMVEDILAIIHVFSCRLYGLRKYKKQITEDRELSSIPSKSP